MPLKCKRLDLIFSSLARDIATRHDPVNGAEDPTARHPIRVGAIHAPLSAVCAAAGPAQCSHPCGTSQRTPSGPPRSDDMRHRLTSRAVWQSPGSQVLGRLVLFIDWQEVSEIDKRTPLVRRPLTYGGLTHEAWKGLLCFFRRGEDPPPIKKQSSRKGNRHSAAKRRPNPTSNFKNLAHNFNSHIR